MTNDQIYDALLYARSECAQSARRLSPQEAKTGAAEMLMFAAVLFASLAKGVKKATSNE